MTAIEQAIKEAMEKGGWREQCQLIDIGKVVGTYFAYFKQFDGEDVEEWELPVSTILLDPSFWQAHVRAHHPDWDDYAIRKTALIRNRNLISHLHSGKDAESFFAAL